MIEQQIKDFYARRIPVSGRLSDYAMLVGQNNQVLSYITAAVPAGSDGLLIPVNPNRVALSVHAFGSFGNSAGEAYLQFERPVDNIIYQHSILIKSQVGLGTELAVFSYTPFVGTVLEFGPMIQELVRIFTDVTNIDVFVHQLIMSPRCCDYIGGS